MTTRISLVKLRPEPSPEVALAQWLSPHADVVRGMPGVERNGVALAAGARARPAVATLESKSSALLERGTLGVEVDADEISRRLEDLSPRPPRYATGVLAKYARLAGSPARGARAEA